MSSQPLYANESSANRQRRQKAFTRGPRGEITLYSIIMYVFCNILTCLQTDNKYI